MNCEQLKQLHGENSIQYKECLQQNLPDLSKVEEKAKELNKNKKQDKIA